MHRARLAATRALGEIEDYRATSALSNALEDKDVAVRRAAAEALGSVESRQGAGPLAKAIDDKDAVVRRLSVHAFGELDDLKRRRLGWSAHSEIRIPWSPAWRPKASVRSVTPPPFRP